jgi:hypothetical protein
MVLAAEPRVVEKKSVYQRRGRSARLIRERRSWLDEAEACSRVDLDACVRVVARSRQLFWSSANDQHVLAGGGHSTGTSCCEACKLVQGSLRAPVIK